MYPCPTTLEPIEIGSQWSEAKWVMYILGDELREEPKG